VLLALVESGLSRDDAYRLVQRNAMRAWEEEQDFRELVRSDSELAPRFALDDERLLLVASDRISTFDVVLPTEIPDKGRVLTGLAAFWFARTRHLVPNHLVALRADGRSTECKRLEMLPLECVVRGYLAGSGWKDYQATGSVCGHVLAEGLLDSAKLP